MLTIHVYKILAAPNTFIYITFFFAMGRRTSDNSSRNLCLKLMPFRTVYTNSLLATLNARNAIRRAGDNVQSTSGINIPASSFSNSFNKVASFTSKVRWFLILHDG